MIIFSLLKRRNKIIYRYPFRLLLSLYDFNFNTYDLAVFSMSVTMQVHVITHFKLRRICIFFSIKTELAIHMLQNSCGTADRFTEIRALKPEMHALKPDIRAPKPEIPVSESQNLEFFQVRSFNLKKSLISYFVSQFCAM